MSTPDSLEMPSVNNLFGISAKALLLQRGIIDTAISNW